MTRDTHRAGGMLVSIVGFALLREKGLLLPEVNEAVQWLVMYPFTMWGSTASDLDHHWESCPTKDIPSRVVHSILHLTKPVQKFFDKVMTNTEKQHSVLYKIAGLFNAKHRSWQTHSDLTLYAMLYLLYRILTGNLGTIDSSILALIVTGLSLGVVAHFILDCLTPEGIWLFIPSVLNSILKAFKVRLRLPVKLHLVPRAAYFATGGAWEKFMNKLLKFCTVVALIWLVYVQISPIISPYIPWEIQVY